MKRRIKMKVNKCPYCGNKFFITTGAPLIRFYFNPENQLDGYVHTMVNPRSFRDVFCSKCKKPIDQKLVKSWIKDFYASQEKIKVEGEGKNIRELFNKLRIREKEIIFARYFLRMGLREIGKAYGVSRERIRQVISGVWEIIGPELRKNVMELHEKFLEWRDQTKR